VCGVDLVEVGEVHRWWTRQAVGEAVGEAPVMDPTAVSEAMVM
jgi:hypothetical protein